jgi:hypothetical protein
VNRKTETTIGKGLLSGFPTAQVPLPRTSWPFVHRHMVNGIAAHNPFPIVAMAEFSRRGILGEIPGIHQGIVATRCSVIWLSDSTSTSASNILAVCPSAHGEWNCSTDGYTLHSPCADGQTARMFEAEVLVLSESQIITPSQSWRILTNGSPFCDSQ